MLPLTCYLEWWTGSEKEGNQALAGCLAQNQPLSMLGSSSSLQTRTSACREPLENDPWNITLKLCSGVVWDSTWASSTPGTILTVQLYKLSPYLSKSTEVASVSPSLPQEGLSPFHSWKAVSISWSSRMCLKYTHSSPGICLGLFLHSKIICISSPENIDLAPTVSSTC